MKNPQYRYLSSSPSVMGGVLVVRGTRTPVDGLLYHLVGGYSVDEIQCLYPWIDRATLKGALDETIEIMSTINDDPTVSQTQDTP